MKFKKKFGLIMVAALTTVILAACGGDDVDSTDASGEKRTFKLAHVVQESHVWHDTANKFNEELQSLSDGRMDLQIYPASQLGAEADMVQQIETGAIDFGFITNAYMSTREVSLNSWFMPYLFTDLEEAAGMLESEETKQMLASLDSQGLVGLGFAFAGNRHVLMKDGFAESPADLKGKKIRIIGSPSMQSYWEKVGAGPTAMPLSEVYTSLQTGVIDGIDIDLDALVSEKYYENAKYLTLTNQMTFPTITVMSKSVFDGLSTEDKDIVKQAMDNAIAWGVDQAVGREKTNLETLKAAGVEVSETIDTASFQEVTDSVRAEFSEKSEIVKSFIETADSK